MRGINELGVRHDRMFVAPALLLQPRTVHVGRPILGPHDVAPKDVAAVIIPDVRMETAVHHDVVFDDPAKTFAVLDSAVQAKIVGDDVKGRTIVEVNVPPVIATPAVVGEHHGFYRVELRQFGNLLNPRVDLADIGPPKRSRPQELNEP